jgi:streptogramin lyase
VIPLDINSYGGVVTANGWVWLDDGAKDRIVRVDSRSPSVIESIPLSLPFDAASCPQGRFLPSAPLVGAGSVWVQGACGAIARIDATTGKVTAMVDTRGDARDNRYVGIRAYGSDGMWVSKSGAGVAPLDPATNRIGSYLPLTGLNGTWVTERIVSGGPGRLWVLANDGAVSAGGQVAVFRIDEAARTLTAVRSGSRFEFGDFLNADGDVFWVRRNSRLRIVDAVSGTVTADVADLPNCIAPVPSTAGAAWCGSIDPNLYRIGLSDGAIWKIPIG